MTDTLRAECEELGEHFMKEMPGRLLSAQSFVPALMAFARAQQAKGLREAAEIVIKEWWHTNCLELMEKIEAQATAREQEGV